MIKSDDNIGGGVVRRRFTSTAGKVLIPGTALTRDEILSIPIRNRRSLVSGKFLELYPKAPGNAPAGKPDPAGLEVMLIATDGGKFDVIEGRRLNAKPLTRKAAEKLALATQGDTKH